MQKKLAITEMRALWLAHLSKFGETCWSKMPKGKPSNRFTLAPRTMTNQTWRPMLDAGLISAEYKSCRQCYGAMDNVFTITDAGRQALAAYRGTVQS